MKPPLQPTPLAPPHPESIKELIRLEFLSDMAITEPDDYTNASEQLFRVLCVYKWKIGSRRILQCCCCVQKVLSLLLQWRHPWLHTWDIAVQRVFCVI